MRLPLQCVADICLWSIGIEMGILGLIPVLHHDNFILPLSYRLVAFKVIGGIAFAFRPLTEDMDRASFG